MFCALLLNFFKREVLATSEFWALVIKGSRVAGEQLHWEKRARKRQTRDRSTVLTAPLDCANNQNGKSKP